MRWFHNPWVFFYTFQISVLSYMCSNPCLAKTGGLRLGVTPMDVIAVFPQFPLPPVHFFSLDFPPFYSATWKIIGFISFTSCILDTLPPLSPENPKRNNESLKYCFGFMHWGLQRYLFGNLQCCGHLRIKNRIHPPQRHWRLREEPGCVLLWGVPTGPKP